MIQRSMLQSGLKAGAAVLMLATLFGAAHAAGSMSAEEFMKAANANADKTLSLDEVDAYAKKRFAAIESDGDKTLSDKELKGRLSEAGMTEADTDKDKSVDEKEFVDYANKLFAEANVHKKEGSDHPTLSEAELKTPAGEKLIMLLR